jgi:hypothetical protein
MNQALKRMEPGDGGDAILDTVSYAVDLLEDQPKEYRRVRWHGTGRHGNLTLDT